MRCHRINGSSVKPDKRADVGIGPYGRREFWRNRKSRPSETQLRCRRKHGSSVKPDRRADVHLQGVGRIRSAPSSLTAALAIGPYGE